MMINLLVIIFFVLGLIPYIVIVNPYVKSRKQSHWCYYMKIAVFHSPAIAVARLGQRQAMTLTEKEFFKVKEGERLRSL